MFKHIMFRFWGYAAALLIIGALIGLHEAGHWAAAELCGAHCRSFNLGFGPGAKVGEVAGTEIWIRSIPFGGFVELPFSQASDTVRSIADLSTVEKVFVFAAGIIVNVVIGVALLWVVIKRSLTSSASSASHLIREWAIRAAVDAAIKDARYKSRVLNALSSSANIFTGLSQGALFGWYGLLKEAALLSTALAIVNVVPVPPLDGARIVDALWFHGVLSAGRPSDTVTSTELVAITSGLALLVVPVVLGLIPGFIQACRFEIALYKRLNQLATGKLG